MKPIAHIRSDFPAKFGIPRQAGLVQELKARVILEPEFRSPEALRGIYEAAGIELKDGYINAGEDTHTNKDGVYAAGDIRIKSLRQIVTAAADGAVAAFEAERYLSSIG